MLQRDHVEFVQAQMLPWRRIGPGLARPNAEFKMLSRDPIDGACSVLMRYPPGWSREGPEHISADAEFFVLDGSLEMDGLRYCSDHSAFLPAGWTRQTMRSPGGCVLLAFYDREPTLVPQAGTLTVANERRAIPQLDVTAMPWDMTLNDPNLRHLGIGRKNLRTDPVTSERTFLSIILPQAVPPGHKGPQETHPTVEES